MILAQPFFTQAFLAYHEVSSYHKSITKQAGHSYREGLTRSHRVCVRVSVYSSESLTRIAFNGV